jgi:hypothetical protein
MTKQAKNSEPQSTEPKQSKNLKTQPTEPRNLLQEMSDRLTQEDLASGLTVTEREPESDTERLTVSFVPHRATKPLHKGNSISSDLGRTTIS